MYNEFCLSIHPSIGTWGASTIWLFWIMLLWTWGGKYLFKIAFSFLFSIYLKLKLLDHMLQFSSVTQLCSTLWDSMDCSTPGFPVHHQLLELSKTHVHQFSDSIQPSHPLLSPSPPALNLSLHQGLFQWARSSHQVAKVLELQLQHQSFQWIFRTDFL